MIKFVEHSSPKYPPRTFENASADVTIAFTFDMTTPGEVLTYEAVRTQNKLYIPVNPGIFIHKGKIKYDAQRIKELNARTINIAGNGVYTTIKYDCDQDECDQLVLNYMRSLLDELGPDYKITLIRSGGQSGFDEAGLKAAVALNIPALCVCPKGWKFVDVNGKTICDEQQFKNRFTGVLNL